MTQPLTPRQTEVLFTIRSFIRDNGFPPTLRELGDILGIKSTNGVNDHLKYMERKGVLELKRFTARGIRVVGDEDLSPYLARAATVIATSTRMEVHTLVAEALAARDRLKPVAGNVTNRKSPARSDSPGGDSKERTGSQ